MARSAPDELTVPPDVAELVRALLEQGRYSTADDVLRAAMHALDQRDKLQALRDKVAASLSDPRPALTSEEVRARLQQRAQKRAQTNGVYGEHA